MSAHQKLLSDPPPRQILPPHRIDDVAQALMALTRELWVVVDRMVIMEQVMRAHGIDITREIDAYQPDDATRAKLDAMGAKLMAAVLTPLKAEY